MNRNLHVTVAAVIEQTGRFLCVEEKIDGRLLINQPAGHLEPQETLPEAVVREVLEESAYGFTPRHLVGIYLWRAPANGHTYLRAAFCGSVGEQDASRQLDQGIERALWLTRDEILTRKVQWRSPLVLRCIDDYAAGCRYPLETLVNMLSHE